MKNFWRYYFVSLAIALVAACASPDPWLASVHGPLDTGADAWRERIKKGW